MSLVQRGKALLDVAALVFLPGYSLELTGNLTGQPVEVGIAIAAGTGANQDLAVRIVVALPSYLAPSHLLAKVEYRTGVDGAWHVASTEDLELGDLPVGGRVERANRDPLERLQWETGIEDGFLVFCIPTQNSQTRIVLGIYFARGNTFKPRAVLGPKGSMSGKILHAIGTGEFKPRQEIVGKILFAECLFI